MTSVQPLGSKRPCQGGSTGALDIMDPSCLVHTYRYVLFGHMFLSGTNAVPKGTCILNSNTFHCSTIYNSQDMEAT